MNHQPLEIQQVDNFENEGNFTNTGSNEEYHKYICVICNHIYDEHQGDTLNGLSPGTRWEDVPEDWRCPECSAIKNNFKFLE